MSSNLYRVGVIILGGDKQQECFWPSYYNCISGYNHDIILVHRNKMGVPNNLLNKDGEIFFENKINDRGEDIPHKAFGAYRHYFYKYKNKYDLFIFISDDVVLKRDNWLLSIIDSISIHEMCGFGASQIFNSGKGYPHESHLRAPFWFAKTKALENINWVFDNDHDGEMKIGLQLTKAGYFGVQVGNKIDLAFDSTEKDHITQIIEKKIFPELSPFGKHLEINVLENMFHNGVILDDIISPYGHIGKQSIFYDIEPFNGLIFLPSLENAKKYLSVRKLEKINVNLIK